MKITFKRILLFGCLVFVAFVAYMAYQLLSPAGPITVSPQTTVITEPLADDGFPDFSKHLLNKMGGDVTPEKNGALPFLQAMWPADIEPEQQAAVTTELQMAIPNSNGMVEPYSDNKLIEELTTWFQKKYQLDEQGDPTELYHWIRDEYVHSFMSVPWTSDDCPAMAAWLKRNEKHLSLLDEAARREQFYLPSPTLLTEPDASFVVIMLPQIQTLRSAVRCLNVRTNYHIGSGDLDAAWQDCLTMYGLSAACSRVFLVGELVSIACETIANRATLTLLDSDNLTPALAREIHAFMQARKPRDNMRPCIDEYERLMFVTSVLEMSGQRQSNDPNANSMANQLGPFAGLSHLAFDWDLMLTIGNEWYDQLVEALEQPTYAQRRAAIDAVEAKLGNRATLGPGAIVGSVVSRNSRTKNIANVLSSLLLPAVDAAVGAEDRANTHLALHQTAAALAIHRAESGAYPDSLESIAPKLLSDSPRDSFGNPLVYRKTADGYLLYSLGKDGQDQGGSSDVMSMYKGYQTSNIEAEDRALRKLLSEPPEENETDDIEYDWLIIPSDSDDYALRLPLLKDMLPTFEPTEE